MVLLVKGDLIGRPAWPFFALRPNWRHRPGHVVAGVPQPAAQRFQHVLCRVRLHRPEVGIDEILIELAERPRAIAVAEALQQRAPHRPRPLAECFPLSRQIVGRKRRADTAAFAAQVFANLEFVAGIVERLLICLPERGGAERTRQLSALVPALTKANALAPKPLVEPPLNMADPNPTHCAAPFFLISSASTSHGLSLVFVVASDANVSVTLTVTLATCLPAASTCAMYAPRLGPRTVRLRSFVTRVHAAAASSPPPDAPHGRARGAPARGSSPGRCSVDDSARSRPATRETRDANAAA